MAALAVLAAAGAGCEYPGVPHPLAAPAAAPASASGPASARPAPPAQTQPASKSAARAAGGEQGRVPVTQKDFQLEPDALAARAGRITFVLTNEGRYTHDFRVEGQGVDEKGPKVGSGRTIEWQLTLEAGTYRVSCPVSNHADRGMVGTLDVVP